MHLNYEKSISAGCCCLEKETLLEDGTSKSCQGCLHSDSAKDRNRKDKGCRLATVPSQVESLELQRRALALLIRASLHAKHQWGRCRRSWTNVLREMRCVQTPQVSGFLQMANHNTSVPRCRRPKRVLERLCQHRLRVRIRATFKILASSTGAGFFGFHPCWVCVTRVECGQHGDSLYRFTKGTQDV